MRSVLSAPAKPLFIPNDKLNDMGMPFSAYGKVFLHAGEVELVDCRIRAVAIRDKSLGKFLKSVVTHPLSPVALSAFMEADDRYLNSSEASCPAYVICDPDAIANLLQIVGMESAESLPESFQELRSFIAQRYRDQIAV